MDDIISYQKIKEASQNVIIELLEKSNLKQNDILIIGCSTSEVKGDKIGKNSDFDVAKAILDGIKPILDEKEIFLAGQCCEHLNRAIVLERKALKNYEEIVNAMPTLKAGGSFATSLYGILEDPVLVEHIKASAGIDIGETLIGMHLKDVAVPVRISQKFIGEARIVCARTRPKFIGGIRTTYDEKLIGGEIKR